MSDSQLKSEELLENITLVILTFERLAWLETVLDFWEGKGVKVVVVDGSAEPAAQVASGRTEWLTYVHAPDSVPKRMAIAAELVETDYVLRSPDDEFFCPSFLYKAVRFLDRHYDYVSCRGVTVSFTLGNFAPTWALHYPELLEPPVNARSPSARYISEARNYAIRHFYSVSRVSQWKRVSRLCQELEIDVANLSEYVVELSMSFSGRSKLLPVVGWYRNLSEQPIRHKFPNQDAPMDFLTWWLRPGKAYQRRQLVEQMYSMLAHKDFQVNGIVIRPGRFLISMSLRVLALNRFRNLPLEGKIRTLTWFLEPFWKRLSILIRARGLANSSEFFSRVGITQVSASMRPSKSLEEVLPEYVSFSSKTYRQVRKILNSKEM